MERLIVKDFKREAKTHKDKLNQNHRVRKRIDTIQQQAVKLVRLSAAEICCVNLSFLMLLDHGCFFILTSATCVLSGPHIRG